MADKANQAADVKGLTQAMAKLNPSGLEAATSSKSIKAYGQIAPIPFSLQNKSPATFGAFGVSGKPGPSGSFSSHAPDVEMGDSDVDIFHCVQHPVLGIDGDTELSSQDKADPKLTGKMAQATYVPSACLFVGNLPCNHTDRQLEDQVYVAFKKFGECYISVHRNGHAMPYCFVQFKEEEHAKVAFNQGAGLTVRGRKIRVEFVKAHRSIFFTRIDGKPVRPEEAIQALKQYSLDDVVIPGGFEKEAYELPEGVWVKFKYYGECQQALQDFPKSMSKYQLYYKQFGLNSKKSGGSTPRRHAALTAVSPAKTVPAKKVDNNENSLVANVIVAPPPFTTLELVHGQFLTFGHIISVAPFLILNDYTRVFVVMYSEVSSADKALATHGWAKPYASENIKEFVSRGYRSQEATSGFDAQLEGTWYPMTPRKQQPVMHPQLASYNRQAGPDHPGSPFPSRNYDAIVSSPNGRRFGPPLVVPDQHQMAYGPPDVPQYAQHGQNPFAGPGYEHRFIDAPHEQGYANPAGIPIPQASGPSAFPQSQSPYPGAFGTSYGNQYAQEGNPYLGAQQGNPFVRPQQPNPYVMAPHEVRQEHYVPTTPRRNRRVNDDVPVQPHTPHSQRHMGFNAQSPDVYGSLTPTQRSTARAEQIRAMSAWPRGSPTTPRRAAGRSFTDPGMATPTPRRFLAPGTPSRGARSPYDEEMMDYE